MTKDELTIAKIEDKIDQCRDGWYVTATGFLDSHEQALTRGAVMHAAGVRTLMYGGYDDAERRMLVCIPAELPISDEEATEGLVSVLRVKKQCCRSDKERACFRGSCGMSEDGQ